MESFKLYAYDEATDAKVVLTIPNVSAAIEAGDLDEYAVYPGQARRTCEANGYEYEGIPDELMSAEEFLGYLGF